MHISKSSLDQEPIIRSLHLPYKPSETNFARIFPFLETVGLLDWRACTICYTVQYNTIRHSTTQLNTKQYNTVHYAICFLWNLSWPGVKTALKIERYTQRLTQGYMGDGLLTFLMETAWTWKNQPISSINAWCAFFFVSIQYFFYFWQKKNGVVPPSTFCVSLHLKCHFMRVLIQGRALNRENTLFLSSKSVYILVKVGN